MKRPIQALLLTTALATSLAFGQTTTTTPTRTPPTPAEIAAHRVAFLTRVLSLTTAQQTQATTIYTASATADATAQAGLKTARQQLTDAIKSGNNGGIESAATTISTLTRQITVSDAKADAAFYQLLTADQKAKYDTMHRFGGPGGRGFGGPGGMGGPGAVGRFRGQHRGAGSSSAQPQQ